MSHGVQAQRQHMLQVPNTSLWAWSSCSRCPDSLSHAQVFTGGQFGEMRRHVLQHSKVHNVALVTEHYQTALPDAHMPAVTSTFPTKLPAAPLWVVLHRMHEHSYKKAAKGFSVKKVNNVQGCTMTAVWYSGHAGISHRERDSAPAHTCARDSP